MADWSALRQTLARYRSKGKSLPIWWRDDDAIEPTAAFDQLAEMAEQFDMSVHLAVIPKPATEALARVVADSDRFTVLVHGWQHRNHAPKGLKKSEFGTPRPGAGKDID